MVNADQRERRAPNPWVVGSIAGMASYIDAAAIVTTGTARVIYQKAFNLSVGEIGVLSGALTLCIAFGALVGGRLGDRYGRRSVFLFTMLLVVIGSTLLTFGTNFALLLTGVLIVGFATGADLPVSIATVAETATDKNRGSIIALGSILWTVGIIAVLALAAVVGNWGQVGGQILFAHVGLMGLLVLLCRLPIPESQAWKAARAERVQAEAAEGDARVGFRALFSREYIAPFLALVGFYTLTNAAANTNGQFNTFVAVNYAGLDVAQVSQIGLASLPIAIVGGLIFMKFVGTRFRNTMYVIGAAFAVLGFALPAVLGFSVFTIVGMSLLWGLGSSFSFEGIMKIWTQESFPTMVRATAQGSVIAFARLGAGLLAIPTPLLMDASAQGMYAVLAVVRVAYEKVEYPTLRFSRAP